MLQIEDNKHIKGVNIGKDGIVGQLVNNTQYVSNGFENFVFFEDFMIRILNDRILRFLRAQNACACFG
uniref:Uncharacterized protein n=1 Tax=Spironucleus salmonicida TaxID=348837 RepID=V6LVN9_9EUKA|eukprot:EST44884.1 Hypothetical protein SS50377_15175 [Spironucleus salmonicida]